MPHGGGGPGIGPIGVAEHLVPFLPGHLTLGHEEGAVASAAWGSASIAAICWMYLSMMGPEGLKEATEMAILNANYIAKKLGPLFPVLYSGNKGLVAMNASWIRASLPMTPDSPWMTSPSGSWTTASTAPPCPSLSREP